jgi:hypothetical protein
VRRGDDGPAAPAADSGVGLTARRKRAKGPKPDGQQTDIPFQEARAPNELRVFPFDSAPAIA